MVLVRVGFGRKMLGRLQQIWGLQRWVWGFVAICCPKTEIEVSFACRLHWTELLRLIFTNELHRKRTSCNRRSCSPDAAKSLVRSHVIPSVPAYPEQGAGTVE